MNIPKNLGLVLLGIWLILKGLIALISLSFTGLGIILGILAIVAGGLILYTEGRGGLRSPRGIGLLLLGVWLILIGLVELFSLNILGLNLVVDLLAIAAGILLLLGLRGRGLVSSLGLVLLAIWLIVTYLLALLTITFPGQGPILALVALIAGILLLLGR